MSERTAQMRTAGVATQHVALLPIRINGRARADMPLSLGVRAAIYRAVHEYPGGAEALAPLMKLSPNTLRHMADPKKDSHGWSLKRFCALTAHAGTGPLEALCQERGGLFVPMAGFGNTPQSKLLKQMHALAREFGDVPREIESALQGDGRITENELRRIEQQISEMVAAGAALLGVVRQIHAERSPVEEEHRP